MPSAVRETLVNGALALGWQQSLNHLAMLVEPEIKDRGERGCHVSGRANLSSARHVAYSAIRIRSSGGSTCQCTGTDVQRCGFSCKVRQETSIASLGQPKAPSLGRPGSSLWPTGIGYGDRGE